MEAVFAFFLFLLGATPLTVLFSGLAVIRRYQAVGEVARSSRQTLTDWSIATLAFSALSLLLCLAGIWLAGGDPLSGALTSLCGASGALLIVASAILALLGEGVGRLTVLFAHFLMVLWATAFIAWTMANNNANSAF